MPALKPIERHFERLDLIPTGNPVKGRGQIGHQGAQTGAKGVQPCRPYAVCLALAEQEGPLIIVAAIDHHHEPTSLHGAKDVTAMALRLVDAEPEHVHGCADIAQRQCRLAPQYRAPTVGGNHQPGMPFFAAAGDHPANPPRLVPDKIDRFAFHMERKAGILAGLLGDEIEQIPLRHHRDIGRRDRQMPEIDHLHGATGNMDGRLIDPAVRQTEQFIEQAQLMEKLESGRMHRVSPEIPKEIRMFLQHGHGQPGPCEQQCGHHPGRTTANDQDIALLVLHRLSPQCKLLTNIMVRI